MKKLMAILNGNKTILILLVARLFGMDFMMDALGPDLHAYALTGLDMLFGGTATHHIIKGKLKADTN